jgi:hypothetical protein
MKVDLESTDQPNAIIVNVTIIVKNLNVLNNAGYSSSFIFNYIYIFFFFKNSDIKEISIFFFFIESFVVKISFEQKQISTI